MKITININQPYDKWGGHYFTVINEDGDVVIDDMYYTTSQILGQLLFEELTGTFSLHIAEDYGNKIVGSVTITPHTKFNIEED